MLFLGLSSRESRFWNYLSLAKNRSFFLFVKEKLETRRRTWAGWPVYLRNDRSSWLQTPPSPPPPPSVGCDLMTGQTEICITLGEVWVTSSPKPPNFPSLGLHHPGRGIPSCNWIVSEFRPGFHLLIGESSQSRLPNLTIQHSSLPPPGIVIIIVLRLFAEGGSSTYRSLLARQFIRITTPGCAGGMGLGGSVINDENVDCRWSMGNNSALDRRIIGVCPVDFLLLVER